MAEYRGRTNGWLSCRFPTPERVAQAIMGVSFFRGASSGCPFGFPIKIHPDRGTLKRKTPSTPATPADFKCRQAATMGGPAQPGQRRIAPALSNCPRLSRSQGCSEPHESPRLDNRWYDKGNAMVFVLQVMYPDLQDFTALAHSCQQFDLHQILWFPVVAVVLVPCASEQPSFGRRE